MTARKKVIGFTLIEMLLVLVIVSVIIYASVGYVQQRALQMRMDRTSTQMQQILNAGLSYYVMQQKWPGGAPNTATDLTALQPAYLPATLTKSPFGQDYKIVNNGTQFFVYTSINVVSSSAAFGEANVIAGTLPLAYTSTDGSGAPPDAASPCSASDTTCYVVASVNVPGQNLNNASAVNYAGLYHNGGCIPAPKCPVDPTTFTTMTPQVMVVPVQVSGTNDGGLPASNPNVYPISSFTAYAVGTVGTGMPLANPGNCVSGGAPNQACPAGQLYWRACMQVVTEKGIISSTTSPDWGRNQSVMAITRCSVSNEPTGNGFNIFSD